MNLHPVLTLAAVSAGGILAGIVGSLIAVPAVALVWAVVDERDRIAEEAVAASAPS